MDRCSDNSYKKNKGEDVKRVFVYGSLRPDDDSRMPWTVEAVKDMQAEMAIIPGFQLYYDDYACAVHTGDDECYVKGWILSCIEDDALWNDKLALFDRIEGYFPNDNLPNLYERIIVSALTFIDEKSWNEGRKEKGASVTAFLYTRQSCSRDRPVPGGDWLQRRKK